ncbi:MAG: flagellar hook-length control protein FliK [Nitrospirota bacterium]
MNIPSAMPVAEKPISSKHASDRSNVGNKSESKSDDNGIFSSLLLMLSGSGNNMPMQVTGSVSQKSQLSHFESAPVLNHSQPVRDTSLKGSVPSPALKEDAGNKIDKTAGMSDSLRMEINMPLSGDSEAYGGFLNSDSFKEDFSSQLDNKAEINTDIRTEIMPNPANDAVNGSSTEIDQTQKYIEHSDIVSQLSETLVDLYHIGGHTAKIRLYPEELGNLHIDINVVDDSIKAVVTVEDIGVKDMLEKNLDILIEELKDSGLNIDQFTVNISSSSDGDNMLGGWSDTNRREMFDDRTLVTPTEDDNSVLYDSDDMVMNAGMGEISIFV